MTTASPRLRRILEIAYAVDGVHGARVWEWPEEGGMKVAVAVRPAHTVAAPELLRRVEAALTGLREPGETWDFGLLDEDET